MKRVKDGKNCFWCCSRRVDGVKCNRGKFSVREGTFLGDSKLSIQNILWLVWHFVHRLSESQCKQYMSIGQSNQKTVVNWYAQCREVCTTWIHKHAPKLGGFGKFDEWVFGLVERGTLK